MSQPDDPTPSDTLPTPSARGARGRALNRFVSNPSSSRNAIVLIVIAQLTAVVIGGLIVFLLDRAEFESLTEAFWYILQTVTTVGYGDVTPVEPIGRLVGALVMLLGIASLSILTASITSSFIEARQKARRLDIDAAEDARWRHLDERLDEVLARLDALERRGG